MSFKVQYEEQSYYLLVQAKGVWTTENAIQFLNELHDEAEKRCFYYLLLDLSEISKPDTEMTRFFSGEHIATIFRYPFKVAAFGKAENINRFAETVAINRGAIFAVFTDKNQAIAWLLSFSPSSQNNGMA